MHNVPRGEEGKVERREKKGGGKEGRREKEGGRGRALNGEKPIHKNMYLTIPYA